MSMTAQVPPEVMKRMENIARFWNERLRSASTNAELARVCWDRARAAAAKAQRGGNPQAMHELAELLATWAAQQEQAEAMRQTRNGS